MSYTTTDLIAGIKRRGAIPTSQATFQVADFLAMADGEIKSYFLPLILSARESYYSFDVSFTITPSNATYAIPTRAVGAKLQNAYLLDAQGNRYDPNLIDEVEIVNPNVPLSGNPSFYIKGNNIVLVPPDPSNYVSLVQTIFIRPSQLVATTAAAQVTSISGSTLNFATVPSTITTSTTCDLIKGVPHYDFLAIDQLPTAVTSTSITFSSLPSAIGAGDWVALSQQAPVVQIPFEFLPMLEQRVANSYLRSQGFSQALQAGIEALSEMEKSFLLINPRSERTPKKLVNRSGLLRKGSWWP